MSTMMNSDSPDDIAAKSRAYCEQLTRRAARNFYYGLKLLPEPKRSAMYALYAYMRLVDDIADDDDGRNFERRAKDLDQWREQTLAVLAGDEATMKRHILWPAFADLVQRYRIPVKIFEDMIAGQRQDLEPVAIQTFDQLHAYCYRVASVVGLASIYVWGFDGGAATEALAIKRGIAFQLTNILRDLREDADKGRTYLPREELARFGVTEEDLASGRGGEAFWNLMMFQTQRAEEFYEESAPLADSIQRDSRPTLWAMTEIYHRLLQRIAEDPARVLVGRVRLRTWEKLLIGWKALRSR